MERFTMFCLWFAAYPGRWLGFVLLGLGSALLIELAITHPNAAIALMIGLLFGFNTILLKPTLVIVLGAFLIWAGRAYKSLFTYGRI